MAKMQLSQELKKYQKKVNKILTDFFAKKKKEVKNFPEQEEIVSSLESIVLSGGKRLRGFLTLVGYKMFGGKENKDILTFSAAVELFHSALLIHDDIIDKDNLRRGKPTLHCLYSKKYKGKFSVKRANNLGKAVAILSANLLSSFAYALGSATNFPASKKIKALSYLQKRLFKTALGEILDIHFSRRTNLSRRDIFRVYNLKTATYTIEAPFGAGAILYGARLADIYQLKNICQKIGQAFQIQDDILGIFGKEKKLGKPVGSDLREGKMILLFKEAIKSASAEEKKKILKYFGNSKIGADKIKEIKAILENLGAVQRVKETENKLTNQIKKHILASPLLSKDKKRLFCQVADFVVARKK